MIFRLSPGVVRSIFCPAACAAVRFTPDTEPLADLDPVLRVTPDAARQPRGTQTGPHAVVVPDGWLDADATAPPDALADASVSGG